VLELTGVGKPPASQGRTAKQPPPARLQVQPARPFRDEPLPDAGWSASHARSARLWWLDRLSLTTWSSPVGLARSIACSSRFQPAVLREGR